MAQFPSVWWCLSVASLSLGAEVWTPVRQCQDAAEKYRQEEMPFIPAISSLFLRRVDALYLIE
jgi:hypothetical protein